MRTADAFGLGGMLVGAGTVDPWSPKVIRGSMGTCLTLPIHVDLSLASTLEELSREHVRIFIAEALRGEAPDGPAMDPWCLVLGSEARGVSESVRAVPHQRVTLSTCGSAGSLGVAAAGAILMYILGKGPASEPAIDGSRAEPYT